jgi:hypothetical protein
MSAFVRVRADPDLPSRLIRCSVCKEPLLNRRGYVLKWFLVDRAARRRVSLPYARLRR